MAFDPFIAKALLDWALGGAAVTRPANRWIEFASGSPTSVSASAAPVQSRLSWNAAAASSPLGAATNRSLGTATATAACTIIAWNMFWSSSGGSRLMWGTFSSSLGCASADTPAFAAGALTITLR